MLNDKNILIIGDLHCKWNFIEERVNNLIKYYNVNKVIFLGDYFDEWKVSEELARKSTKRLIIWKDTQLHSGIDVTFLIGNHDYAYFNPLSFACSGHVTNLTDFARENLDLLDIQLADAVGNYVISHAGVTDGWAKEVSLGTNNAEQIKNELNKMFHKAKELSKMIIKSKHLDRAGLSEKESTLQQLEYCGQGRGGYKKNPGPLWCDFHELEADPIIGINQIVGHTPVSTCEKVDIESGNSKTELWCCDTLSLYSNMQPIGDGSFLLIEKENEPKIVGLEENGISSYSPTKMFLEMF